MTIGVVGLGYVGLPLAMAIAEAGEAVIGVETDEAKLGELQAGRSYVRDVLDARVSRVADRTRWTSDYTPLAECEAVLIAVPTPLSANREPDLTALTASGEAIAQVLRPGQLVVLESTTYPGTTRERLAGLLERSGLVAGEDFHLAFSPERVDPGRTDFDLRTTPKVVGGLTPACLERAVALYSRLVDVVVPVSSPEVAELSKLLENIFRSVNIALMNELAILCERMGVDVWEVADAARTKPYGFMAFEPGPGMGGHCLPVDPYYLSWRAREFDMTTRFVELAGEINQTMPYHCVGRVERALNGMAKPVQGSRIALLGVSYKAGVGDMRESPALKIIALLQGLGADVRYHDAYVPELPESGLRSADLDAAIGDCDLAVIVTAHPGIDFAAVAAAVPRLLDLRGVTRTLEPRPGNVELL